ncbi:hypothetical protein NQ176_g6853 [Zarea fungicola]|uniref:Uncharacterized protein n=1 Tax=Zarea fungicola TaxID=93591 RepID=A0ACC1N3G9_9HYPO|nr:hypothetical protein NQ176_g6853 [Lecanicillium fungicola]
MKFSAAVVAILASVALAASPDMPSGDADMLPPALLECAKKCDNSGPDPREAFKCLKKCADVNSAPAPAAPTAPAAM